MASLIFVSGCNFRCPFCHNADLVDPKKIKKIPLIAEERILTDIKRRRQWIDGVVITGGEPTLQPDLSSFLTKLKRLSLSTMIETNGSRPQVIRDLIIGKLVNYIAMDIKGSLTRQSAIRKSLELILGSGVPFELRTTVVPTIHNEEILLKMAKELSALVQSLSWFLQAFQPKNCLDPKFNKLKPYSRIEMEKFLKSVRKIIPTATLR